MTISPFVITVLKYTFLFVLCFFVWRVARTAIVEMRPAKSAARGAAKKPRTQRSSRGKAPVIIYMRDDEGKKTGSKKLKGPIQVGRDEACELRPDDTYLSQFHARFFPRDGVWYVEDLGSTNGTYLNQQRVNGTVEVHAGDVVRIGTTNLELRR